MKAVILAGGLGTRISEESNLRPKPMIEIGGRPLLWHIMKIYSAHGVNEFVICCGYKGYLIKEYFANYVLHMSDVTFDMAHNTMEVHEQNAEPWRVTLVDTGEETMTGGRLKRVASYLEGEDAFCFTYGDGLANVDVAASIALPPPSRQARDRDRGAAARPLRCPAARRRQRAGLHREAARRRADQRRLLRALAGLPRPHRGRRHELGGGAARPGWPRTVS